MSVMHYGRITDALRTLHRRPFWRSHERVLPSVDENLKGILALDFPRCKKLFRENLIRLAWDNAHYGHYRYPTALKNGLFSPFFRRCVARRCATTKLDATAERGWDFRFMSEKSDFWAKNQIYWMHLKFKIAFGQFPCNSPICIPHYKKVCLKRLIRRSAIYFNFY